MRFLPMTYSVLCGLFFAISICAQSVYEIPAGTRVHLRMDNEINSRVSSVDDTFTATVSEPLEIRSVIVIPVGTVFEGRVTKVEPAAGGGKSGALTVRFETLRLDAEVERDIEAGLVKPLEAESKSSKTKTLTILGGAAIGAIIGGIAGRGGTGAAIGAAVGTGTGAGAVYLQKGKEVRLRASEEFEIELTKKVVLPAQDY